MNIQTHFGRVPGNPILPARDMASLGASGIPADTYGPSRPETLEGIYRRPTFETQGKREAMQLVGTGVMFGGMMAAAALGGRFGPALMIGAMFAGLAIMAAAN